MKNKIIMLIVLLLVLNSASTFGNITKNSLNNEEPDVGVGEPTNIQTGDNRFIGPQNMMVTARNNGETSTSFEIDFSLESLEGLDWSEVDSGTNGPYDLDPDVWIESFFDVDFDFTGYYRATFSLDSPIIGKNWSDNNPKNDKYEAIFNVKIESEVKEWHVDSNASPGGDGSKDKPFQKISDAINSAKIGDLIWVAEGVYNENLEIEKDRITLSSYTRNLNKNPSDCVIDGGGIGNVVNITGSEVIITGFKIQNSGDFEEDAAVDVISDGNVISWNIIEENKASGIYLRDSANDNYIHHNIIQNNDGAGIFIWQQSKNNYLYHNDFINNGWYNVKDKEGGNFWNHSLPYGGNYWDDYEGSDSNGDGIGETPYYIMGDQSQTGIDENPWIEPHKWNNHLGKPKILGKSKGKIQTQYDYDFYVEHENFGPGSDPFTEPAVCRVDWGDGSEEWQGPFYMPSNGDLKVTLSHQWDEEKTYSVSVQFIDGYGFESEWSSFEISMPKNKSIDNITPWVIRLIQRFPIFKHLLF